VLVRFPEVRVAYEFAMFGVSKSERTDPASHRTEVTYSATHESVRFACFAYALPKRSRLTAIGLIMRARASAEIGDELETNIAVAKRRIGTEYERAEDRELLEMDTGLTDDGR
jgi:hypothetical protein